MDKIRKILGSPIAAKTASAVSCAYFAVAHFGVTGSYFEAFNAVVMFFAIWQLGRMTVKEN